MQYQSAYDRVFLSEGLRATGFTTDIETFRRQESDGTALLPDHAAVWASLPEPPMLR